MAWWIWTIVGLGLLAFELFVPLDFWLFFFGLAGITVGLLTGIGVLPPYWIQWVCFGVFAVVYLLIFRKKMMLRFFKEGDATSSDLEGSTVVMEADVAPGSNGKGRARGTSWTVHNRSASPLEVGKSYQVARREGISLIVE